MISHLLGFSSRKRRRGIGKRRLICLLLSGLSKLRRRQEEKVRGIRRSQGRIRRERIRKGRKGRGLLLLPFVPFVGLVILRNMMLFCRP